jgi:hypothetical protein
MNNIVKKQIQRNHPNSYKFYFAQHILELERYKNDITVLCRSLRRSDSFHTPFAHLVGKLLCEALYTKGDRVVNYMQLRIMRLEINRALQEMIAFILDTGQEIPIDRVGQPEAVSVYTYDGEAILLDKNHDDVLDVSATDTKKKRARPETPDASSSNSDGDDDGGGSDAAAIPTIAAAAVSVTPVPIVYNMNYFPALPPTTVGLGPMLTSDAPTAATLASTASRRGR